MTTAGDGSGADEPVVEAGVSTGGAGVAGPLSPDEQAASTKISRIAGSLVDLKRRYRNAAVKEIKVTYS